MYIFRYLFQNEHIYTTRRQKGHINRELCPAFSEVPDKGSLRNGHFGQVAIFMKQ